MLDLLDRNRICQTGERIPPRIGRSLLACTGCAVEILTTAGAKSFAVWRAERTSGQGEQHLLPHDILQQETTLFIIPDFGLVDGNCTLTGFGVGILRSEDEVEVAGEGGGDGLHAAGAEHLERPFVGGAEADIADGFAMAAVLDQQIGSPVHRQGTDLADIEGIVDDAGSDRLVDLQGVFFEIEGRDQHIYKGKEIGVEGQLPAGPSLAQAWTALR